MKYVNAITLELTENCTLRCTYCFTHGNTKALMSEETAKQAIDFLIKNADPERKKVSVSFWGGEPLMRMDLIKKIVPYGREQAKKAGLNIKYNVTTNGTLLTDTTVRYLKENNIPFTISVDGRKTVHDTFRPYANGEGSFEDVLAGIKTAQKYIQGLGIRLSVTGDYVQNLFDDIVYFYKEVGVKNFNFSLVHEHDWTPERLQLLEDQFRKLAEFVLEEFDNDRYIKIRPFEYGIEQFLGLRNTKLPCGAGRHYLGVSSEGALYPCHRFHKFSDTRPWQEQEFCLGHISEGILKESLREQFYDYAEHFKTDACSSCPLEPTCTGHCYASALDNLGDIHAFREEFCKWRELTQHAGNFLLRNLQSNKKFVKTYVKSKRIFGCECYGGCYSDSGCGCYDACYSDFGDMNYYNEDEEGADE